MRTTPYPTSRNRSGKHSRRHPSALLCREFIVSRSRVRGKGQPEKSLRRPCGAGIWTCSAVNKGRTSV